MKKILLSSLLLAGLLATGCIENDIPYPVVECSIETIEAEGLSGAPAFDYGARKVTLPLLETTDIQNVHITKAVLTKGAVASDSIVGYHDMRMPLLYTLSLYQNYNWTVEATQHISRAFSVEGQIGATEWDFDKRTAKVYVNFEDLTSVTIKSLKLGPEGITKMSCTGVSDFNESNFDRLTDLRTPRHIDVTYHGRTERWWISAEYTAVKVSFDRIDGWARTAWLYASGVSGTDMGFCYRPDGTAEWRPVPASDIEIHDGAFQTRIRGLQEESTYEVIAFSGTDTTAVTRFTTERTQQLPNSGFEDWATLSDKILHPYLTENEAFWDTGNKGSATVNTIISQGSPDIRPGSEGTTSAELTSTFAGFAGIGKFAAGNIFIGTYAETVGTNGKVNFGRPFTARPIALRGWIKYNQGTIDRIGNQPQGTTLVAGVDKDQGSIYIAVGTWTPEEYGGTAESPVQIYTKEPSTFFNSQAPAVVGYGEWMITETIGEWRQFTIPLEYKATDIVPTHLIIVCSASRWGDYFTGSAQSHMWLDDFELVWE